MTVFVLLNEILNEAMDHKIIKDLFFLFCVALSYGHSIIIKINRLGSTEYNSFQVGLLGQVVGDQLCIVGDDYML